MTPKGNQQNMRPPEFYTDTSGTTNEGTEKIHLVIPAIKQEKKVMSFESFLKNKTSKDNSVVSRKKTKKSNKDEEVTISIGLKKIGKDGNLKTLRGKKLPIRVPKSANYPLVLEKAVEKHSAFDRSLDSDATYVLLYEDSSLARFMPGTFRDFFTLDKYKNELGKDFKRIVLYICSEHDYKVFETDEENSDVHDSNADKEMKENEEVEVEYMEVFDMNTINEEDDNDVSPKIESDEKIKHEENLSEVMVKQTGEQTSNNHTPTVTSAKDVCTHLQAKVDETHQFFVVCRRTAPLKRQLQLWQRESRKSSILSQLRVKFSGEAGIDSGAMSVEYLENVLHAMASEMFPSGSPAFSTHEIQNGNFRTCGEIVSVSVAQGGPIPCFLDQCAYRCLYTETDLLDIKDEDLTAAELEFLNDIDLDSQAHIDKILEHGYTGVIDRRNLKDIVNSVKVSFVSNRALCMSEFKHGLDQYGLQEIIASYPEACASLFVSEFKKNLEPDANYLFSLMEPVHAEQGSCRRTREDAMMDFLQDLIMSLEDERNMTGYQAPVAWNVDDESTCDDRTDFEKPEISVAGVMGWLTGHRQKHVMGRERPSITVMFDHQCLSRNPKHTLCFPLVGACSRDLTLPVAHMQTETDFRKLFILAYCKGQSFAKP